MMNDLSWKFHWLSCPLKRWKIDLTGKLERRGRWNKVYTKQILAIETKRIKAKSLGFNENASYWPLLRKQIAKSVFLIIRQEISHAYHFKLSLGVSWKVLSRGKSQSELKTLLGSLVNVGVSKCLALPSNLLTVEAPQMWEIGHIKKATLQRG